MRYTLSFLFLIALLCPCAFAEDVAWVEVRSPHFAVFSDAGAAQARNTAGQFEKMRSLFQRAKANVGRDTDEPITVFACRDGRSFFPLLPKTSLNAGAVAVEGMFLNRPEHSYILLRLDSQGEHRFEVVYHEYIHFLLRKARWMPLWLDEGLAEYYKNIMFSDDVITLGEPDKGELLYLREESLIPLETFLAVDYTSPYYTHDKEGYVFYAEAWVLTHMLETMDYQQKTDRLGRYMRLMASGTDSLQAAREVFGDIPTLQHALRKYISQGSYKVMRVNAGASNESSFSVLELSAGAANAARGDMMVETGRLDDARSVLSKVLATDTTNKLALEAMGKIALEQKDKVTAADYFRKAVASGSDSAWMYYQFAHALETLGDRSKDPEVEAGFRKAIQRDPSFAPPYNALGHLLAERGRDLNEARSLAREAVTRDPENIQYRINVAYVAGRQGDFENALRIIRGAMKHAVTEEDKALVIRMEKSMESARVEHAAKPQEDGTPGKQP